MQKRNQRGKKSGVLRLPKKAAVKPAAENGAAPLPFFIAGLGASAGGLEALRSFFDAMPAESGIAFVVVQHLSPTHESMMAELLARNTQMPVSFVEDGVTVEPNRVYLIPPKKCLTIFQGKLLLTPWNSRERSALPIDVFFASLAEERGERAIGIALSGTGSDGTRGIRSIKEAGGLVMIQDEGSAKFSGMPHNAIATGLADFILSASDMPHALLKFVKHPLLAKPGDSTFRPSRKVIQKIEGLVRARTGLDFAGYKPNTVLRRLERRIGISQAKNPEQYLEYLGQAPEEVTALARDLLISVTRFFRDQVAFDSLQEKVIPAIFAHAAKEKTVRIWVPGCATGEEAYSIAILVQEHMATLGKKYHVKIFASDVNQETLAFAAAGLYPGSIAADVSNDRLARHFVQETMGYRIRKPVRDLIVFSRHNILRDPPFTRLDLVSCRNLLIYLQAPAQRKVLSLFHFALRPEGYVFLGSSETVGEEQAAFETIQPKARIFQKRRHAAGAVLELVSIAPAPPPAGAELSATISGDTSRSRRSPDTLWDLMRAKIIADFAPTCFAVNERNEILYSLGQPERFVAMPAGRADFNLLKLVPRNLSLALSTALRQARKQNTAVLLHGIKFPRDGATSLVDLKVESLQANGGVPQAWLIFLKEGEKLTTSPAAGAEKFDPVSGSLQLITELEEELRRSEESLRTAIEQQETSTQELQSSNEQLIASNEELQSTNEELESINEELATLNSEYQERNDELLVANDDIDNFFRTSQIGTIFLDEALHIRKFTPLVAVEMNLRPQDAGRPLSDLSHPLIKTLSREAQRVLSDGKTVEKTVESRPGVWHLLRVSPYRRTGTSDLGIVLTFVDVSVLTRAKQDLGKSARHEKAQSRRSIC